MTFNREKKNQTVNDIKEVGAAAAACTRSSSLVNTSRNNRPLVRRHSTPSGPTANKLILLGKTSDWLGQEWRDKVWAGPTVPLGGFLALPDTLG